MTVAPTGLAYLALVTRLLQQSRVAAPRHGCWEAADLQWAWPIDQNLDPGRQRFWLRDGEPVAAVVLQGRKTGLELFLLQHPTLGPAAAELEAAASAMLATVDVTVELAVPDADLPTTELATSLGFRPTAESYVPCWRDVSELPEVQLPDGIRILSRADRPDAPHHLIARNGPAVAARLAECSLYRPDLDLLAISDTDELAGYVVFWLDPVTGVGLLEPMRTEAGFQRRGVGTALVAEGMRRLTAAGATALKVAYSEGNLAAERLYRGRGYEPAGRDTMWSRPPPVQTAFRPASPELG